MAGHRKFEELRQERDWQTRVVRRGFLFKASGDVWQVPYEVRDLFREQFPHLGLDDPNDSAYEGPF